MPRDLTDRVIVITGASSGIGAATALACAKEGMDLVLNARRPDRLQAVADEIRCIGRRAELVLGDVTRPGMSAQLLDAAERHFGHFNAVFANAGYGIRRAVAELDERDLREIFEVNFFAANDLLREAARRLIGAHRPGHLLMCSSSVARFTLPEYGAYCATKAAQAHVCRAMRMELKPFHIEVSSVHPITTTTEFVEVARRRSGLPPREPDIIHQVPKPFIQSPRRVARAVVSCLRRPRAEVWTSLTVRCLCGAVTAFPWLQDLLFARRIANRPPGSSPPPGSTDQLLTRNTRD
ncbi:MAG: SDR family oxidoreductase [Phycisphaerales bacterium]|nr:MAG: SDR family oxidoreductase [Phycisphaerales bacterium]